MHRASVDEVCARYNVAENVEANKLGLYMGTGEQKLTLYINIPPRGIEADFFNFSSSRRVELGGFQVVRLKMGIFARSGS